MIRETDVLSDLANRSTITVGHACVVASAKYDQKQRANYHMALDWRAYN